MNKKNNISVFFLASFFVASCLFGRQVFAITPVTPSWQKNTAHIDVSAFRYSTEIAPLSVAVPTVVEASIDTQNFKNAIGVARDNQGTFSPLFFIAKTPKEIPLRVEPYLISTSQERNVHNQDTKTFSLRDGALLVDNDLDTKVSFHFVPTDKSTARIVFSADTPITTSKLTLTLDPYVVLPKTVSIMAQDVYGDSYVVLASEHMTDSTIRFPETTSTVFTVDFSLAQPLILEEAHLEQKVDGFADVAVRFLVQPNTTYTLYLDPDRAYTRYGYVPYDGVDLRYEKEVFLLNQGTKIIPTSNSLFVQSDEDGDSIPDERDNCPMESNALQEDIDHNGIGDVCDDWDRDGVIQSRDNCPDTPNTNQKDTDGDGVGDACDKEESRLTERSPWVPWVGVGVAGGVLAVLLVLTMRPRKENVPLEKHDSATVV